MAPYVLPLLRAPPLVAYMLHEAWTELIFLGRGFVMRMSPSKR
jgi:hypothetical protein